MISVLANKSESWIYFTVGQEKFLICPAGGNVRRICRKLTATAISALLEILAENAYGLRGDYTILTMYQAEAIEAQEALSDIKIHELVTSKQGNVVFPYRKPALRSTRNIRRKLWRSLRSMN